MFKNAFKIIVSFLLLISSFEGVTQTVILGSGGSRTATTEASPVNIWYRRSVSQIVYTAAELNAGGITGPILLTQLGFQIRQTPAYNIPGYTIKMKNTTATDVSSDLGASNWTEVKSAFTYAPSNGWDMITLDQSFYWDGVSNIGVEICWSQVQPNYNASGRVAYYTTANGYRYSWTDAAGSSCGESTGTVSTRKPKVKMIFSPFPTLTVWTGAINTDWFNTGNWSAGVPTYYMDASIPLGLINYPVINATGAIAKNLTVAAGATITISGKNDLTLNGNWTNNGTFVYNQSTVVFDAIGSNVDTLNGGVQDFYSIKVVNPNGVVFNTGTYNIYGGLTPNGGTITTNNLVSLASNATSTGRIDRIKTPCSWTLDMKDSFGDGWNSGYLTVYEDGIAIGTYAAAGFGTIATVPISNGSVITMDYTAGYYENENTYTLYDPTGAAVNSGGPNITAGTVLYTGTSSCTTTNPIVGNITANRYLNILSDEWRELSSPITGQTLSNFQDDGIIMAGFPGSNYPNFGWISVYDYDETLANGVKENGWVAATNITDPLNPSQAHRIYIGTGAYTANVTGGFNFGTQTYNLSYQNITAAELAANANQKGWNFVGNPYPCPVNWDAVPAANKVNMYDAVSVWSGDAGNYAVYVGGTGAGTNGLTNNIPSFQGFWVQATSTGASLTFEESHKVNVDAPFVKSFSEHDFMKIHLSGDQNNYYDEVIIDFDPNGETHFDQSSDAQKLFSHLPDAPSLSCVVDSLDLAVNNVPTNKELYIPIRTLAGVSGVYTLSFADVISDASACIILEDTYTGVHTLINDSTNYTFNLSDTTLLPRFVLRILPASYAKSESASCYGVADGSVILHFYGDAPYSYTWNGVTNTSNNATVQLSNLKPGLYQASLVNNIPGCHSSDLTVVIDQPQPVGLTVSTQEASCIGCYGDIDVIAYGGTPPYNIAVNGVEYDTNDVYITGDYIVDVVDNNGCSYQEKVSVQSSVSVNDVQQALKIYPNPADDYVIIESDGIVGVQLITITGQVISKMTVQSKYKLDTSNLPNGVYFIQVIETGKSFKLVVN